VIIQFVALILAAYLLGSLPAAQIMAKLLKGIDLKQFGSGNVGASNLIKATSKWAAIPVILFDIGKGLVCILLARWLGLNAYAQVAIGIAAIAGHNWPVFLNFSGGRGALTSFGVAFILAPWLALIACALNLISGSLRQMAIGSLLAAAFLPVAMWLIPPPLGDVNKIPYTLCFLMILIFLILRRLTAQTPAMASPISLSEKLTNRFLFDRDIRDREAWLNRLSEKHPLSPKPAAKDRNKTR
jgi:glycerol-3-phosphate acyltransferase PlsY